MTRVLVADDHPIFIRGLTAVLDAAGFDVVAEAKNGEEALQALRTKDVDVAIIDVGMPIVNGIGVLKQARAEGIACAFVVLSLHEERSIAEAVFHLGARAYVLKDNAASELIAAIRAACAGHTWVSPQLQSPDTEEDRLALLTPAELRVLVLLADNRTSPQIAERLGLSVRTVQNHRARVCEKLGLSGTHRLLQLALESKDRIRALLASADVVHSGR